MRWFSVALVHVALLASASNASAAYYYISNGTYFITGNVDPPARHASADVAFFTPVAGYQRTGYRCVPLVELSNVHGKFSKRLGTACRSLTVP